MKKKKTTKKPAKAIKKPAKAIKKPAKAIKKPAKAIKKLKKPTKAIKKSWSNFGEWWDKVACAKVSKIEKAWIKSNKPNGPDEDEGGDHWCVNQMMHDGQAHELTYEIAEKVWIKTVGGEPWEMNQGDSLYCDLDDVVMDAHKAAKKSR